MNIEEVSGKPCHMMLDVNRLTGHWSSVIPHSSFQDQAAQFSTFPQFWQQCSKGKWLLLYAAHDPSVSRQQLVKAACACARLVLHLVPVDELKPRIAIETAEAWANGKATLEEVRSAANAANVACIGAAVYAASAAFNAARAALVGPPVAPFDVFDVVYWAVSPIEQTTQHVKTADTVRSIIPMPMVLHNQYLKYSSMKAFW
jgi:hypothetical protein